MSKKLDEEYKALVASEVPDLWARIDAGLKPKTYSAETSDNVDTDAVKVSPDGEDITGTDDIVNNANIENAADNTNTAETEKMINAANTVNAADAQKAPKKKTIYKILPWIGAAAAAALIFAIALPTALFIGLKNSKSFTAENTAPMAMETAMTESEDSVQSPGGFGETNFDGNYMWEEEPAVGSTGQTNTYDMDKMNIRGESLADSQQKKEAVTDPAAESTATGEMVEAEEEEAEETIHARIENLRIEDNRTYAMIAVSDLVELESTDENLSIEAFYLEISGASKVRPEIGGIYEVDFDGAEVILLKKVGQMPVEDEE